jgi:hypothetical protein
MLKDQNNPKVLSAIAEVIKSNTSEEVKQLADLNESLTSKYNTFRPVSEALSHKQKKIAKVAGHPGKIDAADFAALRAGKKVDEDFEIEIDEELSKLLEYEVVRGRDGKFYNDEGEAYNDNPPARRMRRGYSSGPSYKPAAAKPSGESHAVHINGKKWKSFETASHAQNVAKKLVSQGKKATVHKEEYASDGVQVSEAIGVATRVGQAVAPVIARGVTAVKNALSTTKPAPVVRNADAIPAIAKSGPGARSTADASGRITPALTGPQRDIGGRYVSRGASTAPSAPSNTARNVGAGAGAAAATVAGGLGIKAAMDKSVPAPVAASKAKEMGAANKAVTTDAAAKPAKKPMSDFGKAFAAARARGDTTFDWKGGPVKTDIKGETSAQHSAALAKNKQMSASKMNVRNASQISPPLPGRTVVVSKEAKEYDEADHHIHVQLQKAADMKPETVKGKEGYETKGGAEVKFGDGKRFVHADHAHKVVTALNKLRPADRDKLHDHIQQSHANFMAVHKLVAN